MILDRLSNAPLYSTLPAWSEALAFASRFDQSQPDGEYPIRERDIYAVVFSYLTKPRAEAVLEAHRLYADVQIPLAGAEVHGRFDPDSLRVKTDYDPVRDVVFFHHPAPLDSAYVLAAGMFALYLPQDAHITHGLTGPAPEPVRKIVVKVRAELLLPR